MNTTALKSSAAYGGPAVFGAGLAMFAAVVASSDHGVAAAPRPAPTVTVTQTPAPATGRTVVRAPSETPSSARAVESRVLAVAAPRGSVGAESRPGDGEASGPSPTAPPQPPAAASCSGRVLSARALDAVCLKIGR